MYYILTQRYLPFQKSLLPCYWRGPGGWRTHLTWHYYAMEIRVCGIKLELCTLYYVEALIWIDSVNISRFTWRESNARGMGSLNLRHTIQASAVQTILGAFDVWLPFPLASIGQSCHQYTRRKLPAHECDFAIMFTSGRGFGFVMGQFPQNRTIPNILEVS